MYDCKNNLLLGTVRNTSKPVVVLQLYHCHYVKYYLNYTVMIFFNIWPYTYACKNNPLVGTVRKSQNCPVVLCYVRCDWVKVSADFCTSIWPCGLKKKPELTYSEK